MPLFYFLFFINNKLNVGKSKWRIALLLAFYGDGIQGIMLSLSICQGLIPSVGLWKGAISCIQCDIRVHVINLAFI